MGKTGPCRHCGVTSTPLWRNGPPDKPVLCNACGSRWRTKGSLTNYTPLHAREPFDLDEMKASRVKIMPFKPKEQKLQQKKQCNNPLESEREKQYFDQNFRKIVEGDMSNRSSSGSAISNSESYAHVGAIDIHDMTGSAQSNVWESLVPSKKRTFFTRPKPSSVEKLTKDLYSILHEQQSSNLSGSSEEDLLYESGSPFDSVEIRNGGMLIRHPNSKPKPVEEESEASSLPVDNKSYIKNENCTWLTSFPVNRESKGVHFPNTGTDKLRKLTTDMAQEIIRRDKIPHEKLKILKDRNSPLGSADLNDIINFEIFMKHLANEEQQWLMKYLPSIDTVRSPESLRTMFRSPQFYEAVSYFQQLLQAGIFDLSFSGANVEDCKTLERLILRDLERSTWVECYEKLKIKGNKGKVIDSNFPGICNLTSMKRPLDCQCQNSSELKGTMKSPKRVCKLGASNLPSNTSPQLKPSDSRSNLTNDKDSFVENEGDNFRQRSFLASPPDSCSVLAPSQITADSSDHDLLLDVPCNASFPEAELLYHPWKEKSIPNGSPAETAAVEIEESHSSYQSSSFRNRQNSPLI